MTNIPAPPPIDVSTVSSSAQQPSAPKLPARVEGALQKLSTLMQKQKQISAEELQKIFGSVLKDFKIVDVTHVASSSASGASTSIAASTSTATKAPPKGNAMVLPTGSSLFERQRAKNAANNPHG